MDEGKHFEKSNKDLFILNFSALFKEVIVFWDVKKIATFDYYIIGRSSEMQIGSTDREISICITKIFNWAEYESNCSFDMEFFGEDEEVPIIEKSVPGIFLSNSMNLNAPLKITYTNDENTIILKLYKKEPKELLGEFQINLDALRIKTVQYFPFGKDYVLQVNLYTPPKPSSRASHSDVNTATQYPKNSRVSAGIMLFDHDRYQLERENFQERIPFHSKIPNRPYGAYGNWEPVTPKIKKSFSEKVFTLLQEVKSVKQEISVGTNTANIRKSRNFAPDEHEQISAPKIKKSMSDSKFKVYGSANMQKSNFRREEDEKDKNQKKHRLILKTLNVVACEEYYKSGEKGDDYPRERIGDNIRKERINDNYYQTKLV